MTNIRNFPAAGRSADRFSAEEGIRMIKAFESIACKSDREAVIAFAERLAQLAIGSAETN